MILSIFSRQLIITIDSNNSINEQTSKNFYRQRNNARDEYRENEQNKFEKRDQNESRNNRIIVNYVDFDQHFEQYQIIFYTRKIKNVNTIVYYANETDDQLHNENLILKQFSKNLNVEINVYHAETKSNVKKKRNLTTKI